MKIAFVSQPWTYANPPIGCDSIAIWTHQVGRRLTQFCDVVVYGRKGRFHPCKVEQIKGIEYRRVSVALDQLSRGLRLLDRWHLLNPKRPIFASHLYYLAYIVQVAYDLRQQQCDIIHIHNFSQFVPIVRAFNPQAKIVLHMHCEWLTQLDPAILTSRLAQADLIIACSHYLTRKIRKRFPQFAGRCQTVFNGVDAEFFRPRTQARPISTGTKHLLFVGRVSPEKGVHILLEAFQIVAQHLPHVELSIAGPEVMLSKEFIVKLEDTGYVADLAKFYASDYSAALKQQIPSHLVDSIHFRGERSREELLLDYSNADLLINPSLSEAFGMSLVEAMAMEIPVIGAAVGGMTDVIEDGKTGLLVPPNHPKALADAILRLLIDDALSASMGAAGHQQVLELFSWDRVTETLLKLYGYVDPCSEPWVCAPDCAPVLSSADVA
jgi:glycosyltransferase involved in cell wall biosynthesis